MIEYKLVFIPYWNI